MNGDELDKALYDCMNTIWKAYRSGNVKEYNDCFAKLYAEYDNSLVQCFIQGIGMGLVPAVNMRGKNENQNK